MRLRSMLFVPGDSEKKYLKAQDCGADALILDLEDAVAASRKDEARHFVSELLARHDPYGPVLFVRINPISSGLALNDLAAVVRPGLRGLLLPKVGSMSDIDRIAHYVDALEVRAGIEAGTIKLAAVATETPAAMFGLDSYRTPNVRLCALTWGAEDLSTAIGAGRNKDDDGRWTFPYQIARAQCLFAAAAAQVPAIDTLFADYRDVERLAQDCTAARQDGFSGRIAIHPDQVLTINRCFSPSQHELDDARKIVAAFAAQPGVGTIGIGGKMYDLPHLTAARHLIAAHGE